MKIDKNYTFLGKSLVDLTWREQIGINIVQIKRDTHSILNPTRNDRIFPGDELFVIGTELQVQKLKVLFRSSEIPVQEESTDIESFSMLLNEHHRFAGKSIRATGIREASAILVVGIERAEERILNPSSDFVLLENDLLLLVGNKKKLQNYIRSIGIT